MGDGAEKKRACRVGILPADCRGDACVARLALRSFEELDRNPGKSMLETTEITPELVTHVIDRIAQRVRPLKIILFGSHTKQAASQGSDLDLFVVQDGRVSNRRLRREIERLLCQRRFGLDLIVRTQEEFELNLRDGNPFYVEEIVGSGRVVYERTA